MQIEAKIRSVKRTAVFVFALVTPAVAGCTHRVTQENQSIYRFVWWAAPTEIAVFCLMILVGWILRKRFKFFGYPAMLLGMLFLFILPGASLNDRVVVDDDHFEATYGYWFRPNRHNIRFQDLTEIRYTYVIRRRRSRHYQLRCQKPSGEVEIVHVGDLVSSAVAEILQKAKGRGVPIVDHSR